MLSHALADQEDFKVVPDEYVVLIVNVHVSEGHQQVVHGLLPLYPEQLFLDCCIRFLYHPELLIVRILQYTKK